LRAAADGTVWGVNADYSIFRYNYNGTWTQIAGGLMQISAGSSTQVWGVSYDKKIWQYSATE